MLFVIISLRGTNGSGKSTIVRQLFSRARQVRSCHGALGIRYPEAYVLDFEGTGLSVLGPYETSCGGLDRVTNYEVQIELVRKYAAQGHVLFEGLLSGKLWGRMGAALTELAPAHGVLFVYLNTPLDECIRRVVARRQQAGDNRPFNECNLRAVYHQVHLNQGHVQRLGVPGLVVETLSSDEAVARILNVVGVPGT